MTEEIDVTDIEEAKIIISMKNDEIKSIANKMKMLDKKSSIKIAESNYQLQQQKNKLADLEKKNHKNKAAQTAQIQKFQENQQKLKGEIKKLKQSISQLQKNQRQLDRTHKAHLYQLDIKINQEREKKNQLKRQLQEILKIFNPEEIIKQLSLKSMSDIPPYLKLREQVNEKNQEVILLKHQLEQYKTDTLQAMQESFSKLNSYEEVMISLRQKNQHLEQVMAVKQKNLEEKHIQLEQKESFIQKVEAITAEKYFEMSDQIENLRMSVQKYERQSVNYLQNKQQQEKNLKFIFQLSAEFEQKEDDYLNKITQLETAFNNLETQKDQILKNYEESLQFYKDEIIKYKNSCKRAEDNLEDKDQIISMLSNSVKELETQLDSAKKELQKCKIEINELIRRKHKLQQELKETNTLHLAKEDSLLEQIQMLKTYRHRSDDSLGDHGFGKSMNNEEENDTLMSQSCSLKQQMQPQPNWLDAYQQSIEKHNKFVREVHYLLRKQVRKQSFSIPELA